MPQTRIFKAADLTFTQMAQLARHLEAGATAVLPTDTVYGLGTGAYCEEAIRTIYRIKNRPSAVPLQLLAGNVEQVRQAACLPDEAEELAARFWPGGLTMVLPPNEKGQVLTRGFAGLGFRVPANAFLQQLLGQLSVPLACTSANRHGQPVITEEKILLETFDGQVDYILLAGTLCPVASSVVDLTAQPLLLREGTISRSEIEQTIGRPLRFK